MWALLFSIGLGSPVQLPVPGPSAEQFALAQQIHAHPVAPNSAHAKGSNSQAQRNQRFLDALNLRLNNQENIWFKNGRYPTVVQSLHMHYLLNPHDYEIATNLGWMMENIHQYKNAVAVYIDFHQKNLKDPDSNFPLGFFYFQQKDYAKEISIFEPAIHLNPHPGPNTYRILAHTYDRLNRLADSIRVYKAYLAWAPDDLAAIANLKRVTAKLEKSKAKPS